MCFWASCASSRPQSSLRPKNEKKATGYYSVMTKARFGRRTFYEPSLIRIKTDLNSLDMLSWFRRRSWFQLNLIQRRKIFISVKLFTQYYMITYAFGSAHEKVGVWIQTVQKSIQSRNSRRARREENGWGAFQIETGVPNKFRRRTFHVLNSMY